ncbi:MAG TPA: SHOCT domain-containing protein, partial [Solirubrobacteraceae bacterium]|nr:SHOCT domain-containing protein [Solirubrobacteraceae bacterium]
TLFTLATVIGVFAVLAVWANRQVLNTDNWTTTSSNLLADKAIQNAIAGYAVTQLFNTGAVQSEVRSVLPPRLEPAAGTVTAGLQQLAGQIAPRVLASPQVQAAWVQANRAAQKTFLKIVEGGGSAVSTNGGVVTLNLHTVVDQVANSLGVQSQVAAARSALQSNAGTVQGAANKAGITLPPSTGQLVILRSSQLKTAQDFVNVLRSLALVLPLVTFALYILAVWLSRGRRRPAMRLVGWCFVGIGLLVLIVRRFGGNYVVDALVKHSANRVPAHHAWTIATTLLYDIGAALIVFGLILVVAAWLAGHTRPATALRRALAPTLRNRPIVSYVTVYIVLLLVILWGPTPATRQLPYIIAFIVLLGLGLEALRRQTAREFPDAQAGDTMRAIRSWNARRRQPAVPAAAAVPTGSNGHLTQLERLASLHDSGSLTDAEFAAEKAALANGS